jgi:hypothetical protein
MVSIPISLIIALEVRQAGLEAIWRRAGVASETRRSCHCERNEAIPCIKGSPRRFTPLDDT